MSKLDLKLNDDGITYNEDGKWTPEDVKNRLNEYLQSGGDAELLAHFMISTKYWYDQFHASKMLHPVFFVFGFLTSFIMMHYF